MSRRQWGRVIIVLGALLSWSALANAQQKDIGVQGATGAGRQAGYTESWALVIGINQYQHPGIEKLRAAVNDAKAMEAVLPSLGFSRIIRLLDQEATKARIEQELYGTLKQMGLNDRLLIFFSGHGKRVELPKGGEEAWLMPVDADPSAPERTGLPLHEFERIGRRLPAKHVLFILDNCYSGFTFFQPKRITPTARDAFFAAQTASPVVQALTAGRSGEVAYEAEGQGLFTRRLIERLRGSADLDNDGLITSQELLAFVQPRVSRATNGQQNPQGGRLAGEGEFIFVRAGGSVPREALSFPAPLPQISALDEEGRRLEEERRRIDAERALLEERKKLEAERGALEKQWKQLESTQRSQFTASLPPTTTSEGRREAAFRDLKALWDKQLEWFTPMGTSGYQELTRDYVIVTASRLIRKWGSRAEFEESPLKLLFEDLNPRKVKFKRGSNFLRKFDLSSAELRFLGNDEFPVYIYGLSNSDLAKLRDALITLSDKQLPDLE